MVFRFDSQLDTGILSVDLSLPKNANVIPPPPLDRRVFYDGNLATKHNIIQRSENFKRTNSDDRTHTVCGD